MPREGSYRRAAQEVFSIIWGGRGAAVLSGAAAFCGTRELRTGSCTLVIPKGLCCDCRDANASACSLMSVMLQDMGIHALHLCFKTHQFDFGEVHALGRALYSALPNGGPPKTQFWKVAKLGQARKYNCPAQFHSCLVNCVLQSCVEMACAA